MEQRMFTAETVKGLASIVNGRFGEGWRWVKGGGSVSTANSPHTYKVMSFGGFWAVLETESERPSAGFVKG